MFLKRARARKRGCKGVEWMVQGGCLKRMWWYGSGIFAFRKRLFTWITAQAQARLDGMKLPATSLPSFTFNTRRFSRITKLKSAEVLFASSDVITTSLVLCYTRASRLPNPPSIVLLTLLQGKGAHFRRTFRKRENSFVRLQDNELHSNARLPSYYQQSRLIEN